jgi:hypothetical protein
MSTYVAHFRQLIAVLETFGSKYDPSNERLKVPEMDALRQDVLESIERVDTLIPNLIIAESKRHEEFAKLPGLVTRISGIAKASGFDKGILAHVEELVRKIHGTRHTRIKPDNEGTHVSVSQVSYNEQVEHINRLINLLDTQSAYQPPETDLSIVGLRIWAHALDNLNADVAHQAPRVAEARKQRNDLLYAPETGMMATAHAAKEYVKGVFGATSPEYTEVNHIHFRGRKL